MVLALSCVLSIILGLAGGVVGGSSIKAILGIEQTWRQGMMLINSVL